MDKSKEDADKRRSGKRAAKERKSNESSSSRPTVAPLSDTQIASRPDIADQAKMEEVSRELSPKDRKMFKQVQKLLAEHLGSHAAARLWLVRAGTGFETTALDAIRKGQVQVVLATLESQWGPSPTYA